MRKELLDKIFGQICVQPYGVKESYATTFANIEAERDDGGSDHYPPPPNMRLVMTNTPATNRNGQPILLDVRELVRVQMGFELDETTATKRAKMDPLQAQLLAYFESLNILEYEADFEAWYGKDDFVTPQEALERSELNYIGPDIEKMIQAGVMDVVIEDANELRPDDKGGFRKIRRPSRMTVNLYWLRRALAKNATGQVIWFDDKERPTQRFARLTGSVSQTMAGGGNFVTHIVYGRTPQDDAKRRPLDRKFTRLGADGRGFLFIIPIQHVRHALYTFQECLLPQNMTDGTHFPSLHTTWLLAHPTRQDGVKFLKALSPKEAPAAQAQDARPVESGAETPPEAPTETSVEVGTEAPLEVPTETLPEAEPETSVEVGTEAPLAEAPPETSEGMQTMPPYIVSLEDDSDQPPEAAPADSADAASAVQDETPAQTEVGTPDAAPVEEAPAQEPAADEAEASAPETAASFLDTLANPAN